MVMKAEIMWTTDVTFVSVSQLSRHSTDAYNDHVYKNDEGTR